MAKRVASSKRSEGTERWSDAPGRKESWRQTADRYHDLKVKFAREWLLPKAVAGERWAALRILAFASAAVRDGSPISDASPNKDGVADWLADILLKLSEGDSIEEACGIPRRRVGAKKEALASADVGRQFMMAYHYGVRHKFEGIKQLAAEREISEQFSRSTDAVRKAWRKHRQEVVREIALEVEHFGAPWPVRHRKKVT